MRKLIRFLALVIAGGVLVATGMTVVAVTVGGAWSNAGSAQAEGLPPLNATFEEASTVYAADGTTVLGVFRASQNRKPVSLRRVPAVLTHAVLDTEDQKFYIHGGFDIPSMIRALAADASKGGGLQGGSTITQQLVKQTYLTSQRTISRKIKEAVLAERLQQKYTRQQILQAYLNIIYLGNGAYGVQAAANEYFNEDVSKVTLPQAALLAGLIQDPNGYDPILQPAAARTRRSEVLARMVHYGDITKSQAAAANASPLPTSITEAQPINDPIDSYYVRQVEAELLGVGSPLGATYAERYQALFNGGLKIYTNLDPSLQAIAEQRVAQDTPTNSQGFVEAMVAIDPANGEVKALVGGSSSSKFDIITQGIRQPGSGFKVFTLLAALEQGYSINDTVLGTAPCEVAFPGDNSMLANPITNAEGSGGSVVSVTTATADSINCAYIRLAHEVGLPNVIAMAHRLGISETIPPYPSIVIGATAVHPIEMAAAYAAVADEGVYHQPSFINHVVDRTGATIYAGVHSGHRVVSTQIDREAEVAFQAVVTRGTGTGASLGARPAAGKTGTTEQYHDAWFNGFTPQLEATVWMGSPTGEVSMNIPGHGPVYGGDYPATTWGDFMSAALTNDPIVPFTPPNPGQVPPGRFIVSASLRQDDHSPGAASYYGYGYSYRPSGGPGSGSGSEFGSGGSG